MPGLSRVAGGMVSADIPPSRAGHARVLPASRRPPDKLTAHLRVQLRITIEYHVPLV